MDDETRPIETNSTPPPPVADGPMPAPAMPPAATTPLQAVTPMGTVARAGVAPAPASGGSRTKWIIAIGAAVVALAVALGAVFMLGKQASPSALGYIPGDAAFVGEIRLDLPGDQMQKLGNLLAHFPGFADQSTLSDKLDEALSKLVASSRSTSVDYKTDIKPWLNSPAFVAIMAPAAGMAMMAGGETHGVISATTNGAVTCVATFKSQAVTHETYKGLDLVLSADGKMACVVDGRQALLGDPATVRLGLDAKSAGTGMDRNPKYAAARAALGLDRLATLYVNASAIGTLMPAASAVPGMPDLSSLTGPLPDWMMLGVRSEDNSLVIDTVTAPVTAAATGPSLLPVPAAHASVLAPMVPKDTLVFIEDQGTGVTLQNLVTKLQTVPQLSQALQTLTGLGGAGKLVGWIDGVGVAVSVHGTTPDAALLLAASDEASATSTVASLGALLTLAGQGNGLEVKQSTVNGTAVTTVTITDLGSIVPAGTLPGVTIPATGPISFSLAAHGRVVYLTSGEAAMTAILNVAAGSSLADDATFKLAGTNGLANSRMTVYVAAGASLDLVQGFLPAEQLATWKANVAPYVDPLESVSITTASDTTATRSRVVISVAKP
jgi:hypothetical protein